MGLLSALLLTSLASSLVTSTAVSLDVRAPAAENQIKHDDVKPFPQTVPEDRTGQVYLAFQPYLKVEHGCVPFPAVDKYGKVGGGLKKTGRTNGKCDKSMGQIYVRSFMKENHLILVYAWYFPKDSPLQRLGHRHDWEGAAVVLTDPSSTEPSNVVAVCVSGHGDWTCSRKKFRLSVAGPLIKYDRYYFRNHQMFFTKQKGGRQPLISWECLPDISRDAVSKADWGKANMFLADAFWEGTQAKIRW
ncbi:hypothetical protein PZA11_007922 [Diplocarpon coronariae]|uniref:Necrosis inducing protein n=1 Tax=Diplocarpon coronariae TaxID=2795749 RepID=A0A218Z399_9HELO|nr:hypothetical protein JHW43_003956 [Diplocarpon mali]OWP02154.1 hypothetical protein B2J93_3586 [Marssonina coronariae]